jgi:hypothetical protein
MQGLRMFGLAGENRAINLFGLGQTPGMVMT